MHSHGEHDGSSEKVVKSCCTGAHPPARVTDARDPVCGMTVDPRLLATYEAAGNKWHIKPGTYRLSAGESSDAPMSTVEIALPDSTWSASNRPE